MLEGTWGLEKSSARDWFRASADIRSGFINMLSANRPREAIAGVASCAERGVYNQAVFRQLLECESKRSERSGRLWQIILVHWTDAQGRIVQMNSDVARSVIAASVHSFRETDYVGWYRDGHIIGAVLTALAKETMSQVSTNLQPRLEETLRAKIGVEEHSRLQIRVCQPHELTAIEPVM